MVMLQGSTGHWAYKASPFWQASLFWRMPIQAFAIVPKAHKSALDFPDSFKDLLSGGAMV